MYEKQGSVLPHLHTNTHRAAERSSVTECLLRVLGLIPQHCLNTTNKQMNKGTEAGKMTQQSRALTTLAAKPS